MYPEQIWIILGYPICRVSSLRGNRMNGRLLLKEKDNKTCMYVCMYAYVYRYNFYSNLIIYNCKTKVAIAEALSSTCCVKSESRQSFCATAKLICTFCIPKYNVTVRFFSDFRELDKTIKTKPFPIPKQSRFLN